jgi:HSP20 family protein
MSTTMVKKQEEKMQRSPGTFNWSFPFGDLWNAMDRLERHFTDHFGTGQSLVSRETLGAPAVDLYREKDSYIVEAALPGMDKKDIVINCNEDSLVLSGEHKDDRKIEQGDFFWQEIKRGKFQRSFAFAEPINADKVKATFKDGMLKLVLPIKEPQKSKEIKINIE